MNLKGQAHPGRLKVPTAATLRSVRPTPSGLPAATLEILERLVDGIDDWTPKQLLVLTQRHRQRLQRLPIGRNGNSATNLALAGAIVGQFEAIVAGWDDIPLHARPWLKAAMLYFIDCDDQISDQDSAIGFRDDAAVLGACLELADVRPAKAGFPRECPPVAGHSR